MVDWQDDLFQYMGAKKPPMHDAVQDAFEVLFQYMGRGGPKKVPLSISHTKGCFNTWGRKSPQLSLTDKNVSEIAVSTHGSMNAPNM